MLRRLPLTVHVFATPVTRCCVRDMTGDDSDQKHVVQCLLARGLNGAEVDTGNTWCCVDANLNRKHVFLLTGTCVASLTETCGWRELGT